MRLAVAFAGMLLLAALSSGSFASEIRKGAAMQVKPNSIWFQDTARLTRWQKLKKSGDLAALASYQDAVLSRRDAWQFIDPLTVKILGYKPGKNRVNVEMQEPGRLAGTTWWLDADALAR
jgi:hypothetical protein